MKRLYFILTLPLIVPHLICYSFTKSRKMIDADAERHSFVVKKTDKKILRVAYLLIFQKEFRNLYNPQNEAFRLSITNRIIS